MGTKRTAGVVAGVVTVGAVAAAVTVFHRPDSGEGPGSAATAPAATAEIAEQTLLDRENHDGTLGHGDSTTISARAGGTVTRLPAEGSTVSRGKALYHLDDKPVTLLYGPLPAYRTLSPGAKGSDVKQLERNLWALGYRGFTVDTAYSHSTATAVRKWQGKLGRARTGKVTPGEIVYAEEAVRVDALSTQVGALVGPGVAVEKITGTRPLASAGLETASARLARVGAPVQVTMPDGKVVPGTISKVVTVVTPGENGAAATTRIAVTVRFDSPVGTTGTAAVRVAFTAGQKKDVLAVPVTALLALAEGGYGVEVVDGTTTRTVAVTTGLFAGGKVEITGDGLRAGMKVGVPS